MGDYVMLTTMISIHAPRAGSDALEVSGFQTLPHFNPRSPCGERHGHAKSLPTCGKNFNPRSPCGERLQVRGDTLYTG